MNIQFVVECEQICHLLYTKYNGSRSEAAQWLDTPNNGNSPRQLIHGGHSNYVLNLLFQ